MRSPHLNRTSIARPSLFCSVRSELPTINRPLSSSQAVISRFQDRALRLEQIAAAMSSTAQNHNRKPDRLLENRVHLTGGVPIRLFAIGLASSVPLAEDPLRRSLAWCRRLRPAPWRAGSRECRAASDGSGTVSDSGDGHTVVLPFILRRAQVVVAPVRQTERREPRRRSQRRGSGRRTGARPRQWRRGRCFVTETELDLADTPARLVQPIADPQPNAPSHPFAS